MSWTKRGAFVAGLIALLPAGARAAYGIEQYAGVLVSPAGATQVCQGCSSTFTTTIQLPFNFTLYGKTYKSVSFGAAGLLAFEGGSRSSAAGIPDAGAPNAIIAPWWAPNANATLRYAVSGEAPQRKIVFSWSGFYAAADNSWNGPDENALTVTLFESSSKIEIRYQRTTNDARNGAFKAAVGIESSTGTEGVNLIACSATASCEANQFPDGQVFRLTPGQDAAVESIQINNNAACQTAAGVPCAYAANDSQITARLRNLGGDSFSGARVAFYLSEDAKFSEDDVYMGESEASDAIGDDQSDDVSGTATFPDWTPGEYYLIAVADSGDVVAESDEINNAFVNPVPVTLRKPGPNVVVSKFVSVPGKLTHSFNDITVELRNEGIRDAVDAQVAVVLSSNQVVSMQDVVVYDEKLSGVLAAGQTREETFRIDVPDGMPNDAVPGIGEPDDPYFLGVIVDPHDAVDETSELDNTFTAGQKIKVGGGALSIVTTDLPDGGLGSPYGVQLLIAGGDGAISWEVDGAPGGLTVDETGFFHGSPGQKGEFQVSFTVSDTMGSTDTQVRTLNVLEGVIPLRVVTGDLPQASFGVPYEAQLRAVGGCGPYSWNLQPQTVLPAGVTLTQNGLLAGIPRQAGSFELAVTVTDSCSPPNAGDLTTTMLISDPPKVTIAEIELPPATVAKNYTAYLHAAGGEVRSEDEYQWSVLQTVRLPIGEGDTTDFLDPGEGPPGLAVLTDGTVTGAATKAGSYLMTVRVEDMASPKPGYDEATILVRVVYDAGMSIVTLSMPDAVVNQAYTASIAAAGGVGSIEWTLAGDSELPPGLALDKVSGDITGTPETGAVESGKEDQIWPFLVSARDSQNRTATQVLAIRVTTTSSKAPEKKTTTDVGCSAAGGGLSAAGMLLALALLRRRRR